MTNDSTLDQQQNTTIDTTSALNDAPSNIPSSLLTCKSIHTHESRRLLKILFDSGGSHTMIDSSCLPVGVNPTLLPNPTQMQTIAGSINTNRYVRLSEISLPEFDRSKIIDGNVALVFDSPCQYDMIVGRDFLQKIDLKLNFDTKSI